MKKHIKLIAVFLALTVALTGLSGCDLLSMLSAQPEMPALEAKAVIEFTYTEAELDELKGKIAELEEFALANNNIKKIRALEQEIDEMVSHLYSQVSVASVLSYADITDTAAEDTYNQMTEWYNDVVVLYNSTYKKLYESAPAKEKIFEDWTEAEIEYMFKDLETIADYSDRFSELSHSANMLEDEELTSQISGILKEMISVGNLIADKMGYDNYFEYANDITYSRDYSAEDTRAFRKLVKENVVDNIGYVLEAFYDKYSSLSAAQSRTLYNLLYESPEKFSTDYIAGYIDTHSGTTKTYLNHAFNNENYMIGGDNAASVAFCTYISDNQTAFMFFAPDRYTCTTFVHELGHYYASLFSEGSSGVMDVNEIQSQANEMLFMNYLRGNFESKKVIEAAYAYYIYELMATVVAATIINDFEERIYTYGDVSSFTVEDFDNIMEEVLEDYGGEKFISENIFDAKSYWKYVVAQNPMYYLSYATSGIAALSIMALGAEDTESAYEAYRVLCEEISPDCGYVEALCELGIATPFTQAGFDGIIALLGDVAGKALDAAA